jgi:very-short-patch-repair endonuclease
VSTVQDKLSEWKRQLLDLSKRNRLLHFRETKRQTLRVQLPEPEAVFARVALQEKPLTVVGLDQQAMLDLNEAVPEEDPVAPRLPTVNQGEILFSGSVEKVASALYTLRSRSRTELEERGVGVLYVAFGFLHWYEADQSDYEIISPLVLVPVDLQRDTAVQPYRLLHRDDDIVVNPTLRKVMEDQFKIELPDLPDEESWSLAHYLAAVTAVVSPQARWRVEDAAFLSVFSFLKLNMYRDLEMGLDAARQSAIIQALAGDLSLLAATQGDVHEIPAEQLDERVDPAACLQVLDADSSQQQAIELAKAGASFVLQGPPGTGKSQTIANVIAELLGLGRTVLFVSEKAAALDVVHRRLTAAGLADACLAVHSQKANKRDVVAELARVYALGSARPPEPEAFNYARLRERRSALSEYVRELHLRREPLGRSVFEVEGLVAELGGAPEVPFNVGDITLLTSERLESMRDAVARLSGSADVIATLRENPWRGSIVDGQSLEVRRVVSTRLSAARGEYSHVSAAGRALADALALDRAVLTPADVGWLSQIALALADGPEFMGAWLSPGKLAGLIATARDAREQYAAAIAEAGLVGSVFTDAVLCYDLDGLSGRMGGQYRSLLARVGGAYRQESRALAAFTKSGKKPSFAELTRTVPAAVALRDRRSWLASQDGRLRDEFGPWYSGYGTEWSSLQAALDWAQQVLASFEDDPPEAFRLRIADILSSRDSLRALAQDADGALATARGTAQEIAGWFAVDARPVHTLAAWESTSIGTSADEVDRLGNSIEDLASWTRLSRALEPVLACGVGDPIPLLEDGSVPADDYVDALARRTLTLWLDYWIGAVTVLRDFESKSHAHLIEEFRRLDSELMNAARRTLRSRLAERRPHPSAALSRLASSQPALLMKEAKKKRRHKPLRRLFAEIPDLLVALKPCMMMSPLSVGQFLPLESARFDAVVFDEASQVKPEDAVGTIMRGKQVIVVGDSKQLPPTSFFDVSMADDFDEDDYYDDDTGAFESILDLCGTVGLPERMLQWHYRSRREGLIAFSNHFLYDDRLVTFPAPDFDGAGTGVEFRHVPDGIYDRSRSRTNAREVQEVLEVVRAHAMAHADKSLGVVAFSQAQMTAIDTALWRLRGEEPALDAFIGNMHDEPFFVKNLENVQGDERDVIIFSVGYGRDVAGKLAMNFGPLNNRGGERRLNVAVTRAREGVVLVSSIRGADIDVARSQAEGVRLLKHYLDYAEHGVAALDAVCTADPDAEFGSVFEEQVARVLESKGFQVHRQVGCSGYRIDLAIVHPSRPGQYALGIECDGASYHSAATARERDRLREQVLTRLRWKLYRIWSTDWFRARPHEVGRLVAAVEAAIVAPEYASPPAVGMTAPEPAQTGESGPVENQAPSPTAESDDYLAGMTAPYIECRPAQERWDFYTSPSRVKQVLVGVVGAEGPIRIDVATRRVASAWGFGRAGRKVQEIVQAAARTAMREGVIVARGQFLYLAGVQELRVRRNTPNGDSRKAVEIAPEEIAEAARLVLRDQIRLSVEDLTVATARVMGFERTGSDVRSAVLAGIRLLVSNRAAEETNGDILLRT